jgi:hypothetical protein
VSHNLATILIVTLIVGGLTAIVGLVKALGTDGNRWMVVCVTGLVLVFTAKITSIIVIGSD